MNNELLNHSLANWISAVDQHNNGKHPNAPQKQINLTKSQEAYHIQEAQKFIDERNMAYQQQKPLQTAQGSAGTPKKPLSKYEMMMKLRGGLPNERPTLEETQRLGRISRTRKPRQNVNY